MPDDRGIHEHVERLRGKRTERGEGQAEDLPVVRRAEAHAADDNGAMKVGIVVPYSWSFWGGVVEHAELQAEALTGSAATCARSWATIRPASSRACCIPGTAGTARRRPR